MRSAMILVAVAACVDPTELGPDAGDGVDADQTMLDAGIDAGDPPEPALPTADELRARVASCADVVGGPYAYDSGEPADLSICGFAGAVAWHADLDVDCDGKPSAQCNLSTDPYFLDDTAAHDSNGEALDAAALPFVVVPGRSFRFDYRAAGLAMGTVVAVIYGDRVEYGPLGDVGPTSIIGEASYAMAERLGIDPDPSTGGVEGGVTYIAFTGDVAKLSVIEDHAEAIAVGVERARDLLAAP